MEKRGKAAYRRPEEITSEKDLASIRRVFARLEALFPGKRIVNLGRTDAALSRSFAHACWALGVRSGELAAFMGFSIERTPVKKHTDWEVMTRFEILFPDKVVRGLSRLGWPHRGLVRMAKAAGVTPVQLLKSRGFSIESPAIGKPLEEVLAALRAHFPSLAIQTTGEIPAHLGRRLRALTSRLGSTPTAFLEENGFKLGSTDPSRNKGLRVSLHEEQELVRQVRRLYPSGAVIRLEAAHNQIHSRIRALAKRDGVGVNAWLESKGFSPRRDPLPRQTESSMAQALERLFPDREAGALREKNFGLFRAIKGWCSRRDKITLEQFLERHGFSYSPPAAPPVMSPQQIREALLSVYPDGTVVQIKGAVAAPVLAAITSHRLKLGLSAPAYLETLGLKKIKRDLRAYKSLGQMLSELERLFPDRRVGPLSNDHGGLQRSLWKEARSQGRLLPDLLADHGFTLLRSRRTPDEELCIAELEALFPDRLVTVRAGNHPLFHRLRTNGKLLGLSVPEYLSLFGFHAAETVKTFDWATAELLLAGFAVPAYQAAQWFMITHSTLKRHRRMKTQTAGWRLAELSQEHKAAARKAEAGISAGPGEMECKILTSPKGRALVFLNPGEGARVHFELV